MGSLDAPLSPALAFGLTLSVSAFCGGGHLVRSAATAVRPVVLTCGAAVAPLPFLRTCLRVFIRCGLRNRVFPLVVFLAPPRVFG
jgi:hypothetical protein